VAIPNEGSRSGARAGNVVSQPADEHLLHGLHKYSAFARMCQGLKGSRSGSKAGLTYGGSVGKFSQVTARGSNHTSNTRSSTMAKKQAKDAAPPAATAVFVKPETVAPANRKGASTIDNPVGETWITCINATAANDGAMPERKVLNQAAMDRGVAYYTARTQVQAYRKWFVAGADPTQGLPRGVVIG